MKELKPKLMLPGGSRSRGRSSFRRFIVLLVVFALGVFVGMSIGGMRELYDLNGKKVVGEYPQKRMFDEKTVDQNLEVLSHTTTSSKGEHEDLEINLKGSDDVTFTPVDGTDNENEDIRPEPGYTVQLGAFKEIERAEKARSGLNSRGYEPYIIRYVNTLGETWFLVRIGKFDSRESAREYATLYQRKEGLEAIVEEIE